MAGPIVLVVVLILVVPPLVLMSGLVFSAVLGWLLMVGAEGAHEGSELVDLNC